MEPPAPAPELPAGAGLPAVVIDGGVTTGGERMPAVEPVLPAGARPPLPAASVEPAEPLVAAAPATPLGFEDVWGSVSAEHAATQPINTKRNAQTDVRASLITHLSRMRSRITLAQAVRILRRRSNIASACIRSHAVVSYIYFQDTISRRTVVVRANLIELQQQFSSSYRS
jgi:hypothetical protein